MSSKIKIDNASGQVLVDDQSIDALAITSGAQGAGQTLISDSNLTWSYQDAYLSWRNRIINGDMVVAQRGTSFTGDAFPADRWNASLNIGTVASSQSSDAPTGFSKSILFSVTTGASATGTQYANIQQSIEGYNIADFAWGTSSAKPITISFWAKASLTGTYCLALHSSISNRSYVKEYQIASANTWSKYTITIAGDTSGSWNTTNSLGVKILFSLGDGSSWQTATASSWVAGLYIKTTNQVNVIGTTGATFYLTGVQLELGTVATPFEYLPYSESLNLCKRYFARYSAISTSSTFGAGAWATTTLGYVFLKYEQQMRSAPTITLSGMTLSNGAAKTYSSTGTVYAGTDSALIGVNTSTTAVIGNGAILQASSSAGYITFSSEL